MYDDILYDELDGIATLTINRPTAKNSLTGHSYAEITHAVEHCSARCLVITGTGDVFCAGDDVKQVLSAMTPDDYDRIGTDPQITNVAGALLATDIPVITAVNGPAVGWGMELALLGDIIVASDTARFGELFVKRGLCCDVAGFARLASLVGRAAAAELLFTGRIIDAETARGLGLVSRVVPFDQLLPVAHELAGEIAGNPPLAVAAIKRGLRQALDPDFASLGSWTTSTLASLFRTADHREGVSAFMERRQPTFTGT